MLLALVGSIAVAHADDQRPPASPQRACVAAESGGAVPTGTVVCGNLVKGAAPAQAKPGGGNPPIGTVMDGLGLR